MVGAIGAAEWDPVLSAARQVVGIRALAEKRRTVTSALAVHEVTSGATVHMIRRSLRLLRILPDIASHAVVSLATEDDVGPQSAPELIVALAAIDTVAVVAALDLVVTVLPSMSYPGRRHL